ncbi:MAG: hypothetical protein MUC67_13110 [Acidobacteria bacterium]|nr:hypothetical protein [Acidobacteriota bacterium]
MSEPLRHIVLELLSVGRLVVVASEACAHGRERTIFRRPIEAAIFIQLLVNQLELQAGERPDERVHRRANQPEARAPRAA